jgi:subtilisin family serine protease
MHMNFRPHFLPAIGGLLAAILLSNPAAFAEDPFVEGEVIVTFKPQIAAGRQNNALARHRLSMTRRFGSLAARSGRDIGLVRDPSRSTAALIALLKTDPNIATAEPNYLRRLSASINPDDPEFPKLWGLKNSGQTVNFTAGTPTVDIRFTAAWRLTKPAAAEVVIGILDSGVEINHPDLAANIWTNPGEIPADGIDNDGNGCIDDIHGFDFASNTGQLSDSGNHGTHVAGIAAAVGRNATGVIGVGFKAKILPLKASNDGNGILTSATLAAYDYAVSLKQSGVNIVAINASFGGNSFSFAEQSAIAALRDAGIILCAAAGNETTDNDTTPTYPANYNVSNIISVASLTQTNQLAGSSNFGATTVDLAAPGTAIQSTRPLSDSTYTTSVTVDSVTYAAQNLLYAVSVPPAGITGTVVACGIGTPADFPTSVSGNIALIQRGTLTFAAKVSNAINAGATACIIWDNTPDPITPLGWQLTPSPFWIPALRVTQASGQVVLAQLPASATLPAPSATADLYQFLGGTSMAAPHVAGAVAFAAINFPAESVTQRIARILDHVTPVPALAGKTVTGGRLDLLTIVDTDNDGLPDWWETNHFGNLAQAATDNPDGDNFPNLEEFLTGTAPTNAASQLAFSNLTAGPGPNFHLTFPSVMDSSYKIDRSDDLTTWQTLASPVPGTGSSIEINDSSPPSPARKRFYRISLLPE